MKNSTAINAPATSPQSPPLQDHAESTWLISVRFFAGLKERIGSERVELELPAGATVGDLRERLAAHFPGVKQFLVTAVFAVDNRFVSARDPLSPGAEVLCFPPVSGG